MNKLVLLLPLFLFCGGGAASAQNPTMNPGPDPMINISSEMTKISRAVATLNGTLKTFVDKFEKVGGMTLSEKQQDIVFGMELLIKTEQLIAALQKSQIDLTEKMNETRSKLAQVDVDLRPRSIDRSLSLVGTTETEELRDNRRQKLQAERISLTQLFSQIQDNLAETNDKLRNAQILANTLRRQYLPQIDKEIYKQ